MITVISPAKKLDFDSPLPTMDVTTPDFLGQSRKLNKILREYPELDLMELMHISKNIAELNVQRNKQWKTPFTTKNARPALLAFKGDVYQGLDAATMKPADLKFSQKHLRILSGLYGLLRPLDLMQAYRLEMGTKLANASGNNLYEFWGETLTNKLNEELSSQRSKFLINLASNEYFKAVKPRLLDGELITPAFKERKNGTYKMIGIFAKKARGLMSRYMIKNRIDQPEELKSFDLDGYAFNEKLSNDSNWVFTRG
jgi:cytoplasmic iron level regulating protein YaaA (DUF328/UPF0246 family)